FSLLIPQPPISTLFPYTTLFRSCSGWPPAAQIFCRRPSGSANRPPATARRPCENCARPPSTAGSPRPPPAAAAVPSAPSAPSARSEEHTSELQSRENLVCRLLLE